METKVKKGKAIIGIAMVAIVGAVILAAMVPTVSANPAVRAGDPTNVIFDVIYQGEKINFTAGVNASAECLVKFYRIEDTNEIFEFQVAPDTTRRVTADIAPKASYNLTYVPDGVWCTAANRTGRIMTITTPIVVTKILDIDGKDIESTTVGESIKLSTSSLSLPMGDYVKVKHENPDGDTETLANVTVANLTAWDTSTTGWIIGEHKLWIVTVADVSYGLDKSSDKDTIALYKSEIEIEAETETPSEEDKVTFTVRAPPNTFFNFSTTHQEDVTMTTMEDNPCSAGAGEVEYDTAAGTFTGETNEDGLYKFIAYFTEDRMYTLKVWFNESNRSVAPTETYAGASAKEKNEIEIDVQKMKVTMDVPVSAIIGETVTIRGTVPAGYDVDIYIEKVLMSDDETVANGEFEYKWDTAGLMAGTKRIQVYVDCPHANFTEDALNAIEGWDDEDGHASIRLVVPGITAEQPRDVVAKEDDYTVKGTATGVSVVDIIIVGPDGFTGESEGLRWGLKITSASVAADNTFDEDINIPADADAGRYTVLVLSPGRDMYYGGTNIGAGDIESALEAEYDLTVDLFDWLKGKDTGQLISLFTAATADKAGNDDLLVALHFSVESAYVRLNPAESVAIGEPLNLTGTTNREPGTTITITTLEGPAELMPDFVEVEWPAADEGVFSATIDTTDVVVGTYTLEADDGDGNTDTITVEIVKEIVPIATPEPTAEPTEAPAVPTPEPTAEPTPTPTEEPGFEAVFAIAGLLSIAYLLVLRRRK